jgi:cation/acetate symporter
LGAFGIRRGNTTSDLFVASRSVTPGRNASAICGEYLSAASFLGVAGLVMKNGADMMWYPLSYTAGYVLLLLFVAAPLRRFGAYTISDFAEGRLESLATRRVASLLVVGVSCCYLVPQMRGAGVTLRVLTGAPYWLGVVLIATTVTVNVATGGMRGITFVQGFQFWLKWAALAIPALFIAGRFLADRPAWGGRAGAVSVWALPVESSASSISFPAYALVSFFVAQMLGTLGLPHILVRFYTNPDGPSARRTTVIVLGLLGLFYVFTPVLGALGRLYAPELLETNATDTVVLLLPQRVFSGGFGELLGAVVACGAFAAFMSTASGLTISAAGAVSQDLLSGDKRGFRLGALIVGALTAVIGLRAATIDINQLVSWAFAIAGSSFTPLVVLGIWWRGLSARGAVVGLLVGAGSATASVAYTLVGPPLTGWVRIVLAQPAIWSIPLAFATMIVVSLLTPRTRPKDVSGMMLTMHAPESLGLSRAFR